MKLIGSLTSPFVRKVRIVLAEKKLDYEFEQENVWAPETRIQLANPLGKVPCLILDDGGVLIDSRVIAAYLDTLTPHTPLFPSTDRARVRADVQCWEALADGVADAAILVRLERTLRSPEQQSPAWTGRQLGKVELGLAALSHKLGDAPLCVDSHYSLADVALACLLGWLSFRFPELDWRSQHPNLARLFDTLSERPSFQDTVPQ